MYLIPLLLAVASAARCTPGLPGACPLLANVTAGHDICPEGGARMYCPENTTFPVFVCNGQRGPPAVITNLPGTGCASFLGSGGTSTKICNGSSPIITPLNANCALIQSVGDGSAVVCNGSQGIQGLVGPQGVQGVQGPRGPVGPPLEVDFQGPVTDSLFAPGYADSQCVLEADGFFQVVVTDDLRLNKSVPVFVVVGPQLNISHSLLIYDCMNKTWDQIGSFLGAMGPPPTITVISATTQCILISGTGQATICNGSQGIQGPQGVQGPPPTVTDIGSGCSSIVGTGSTTICNGTKGDTGAQGPAPTVIDIGSGCATVTGTGSATICNGTKGDTGSTGATGAQGPAPTVTNIGSGCATITGTGSTTICNGTKGDTGATGATGATGPAGSNATISAGNTLFVDQVFGSDSTGFRQYLPFKTIGAALTAAVSGDFIEVRPGTYSESGLSIPAGVTVEGTGRRRVVISATGIAQDTTMVTLGTGASIRRLSISMTSSSHVYLCAISRPNTGAFIEEVSISIDNTAAPAGGTSDVFGILSNSSGVSTPDVCDLSEVSINVQSADFGRKRMIQQESGGGLYACRVTGEVKAASVHRVNGTYIGVETGGANQPVVYLIEGSVFGTTADISQTTGRIVVDGTTLVGANANGIGFSSRRPVPTWQFSDNGGMNQGSTRYYPLGTFTLGTAERWQSSPGNCIAVNLSVSVGTAPGGVVTDSWNVRRSVGQAGTFSASGVTATITGTSTTGISTGSQHFDKDDRLEMQVTLGAGTATTLSRVFLGMLCYG